MGNVLSAIPQGVSREEWLQALPRALVAGFVKTDIEFQQRGVRPYPVYYAFDFLCCIFFCVLIFLFDINDRGNFWDNRDICCD